MAVGTWGRAGDAHAPVLHHALLGFPPKASNPPPQRPSATTPVMGLDVRSTSGRTGTAQPTPQDEAGGGGGALETYVGAPTPRNLRNQSFTPALGTCACTAMATVWPVAAYSPSADTLSQRLWPERQHARSTGGHATEHTTMAVRRSHVVVGVWGVGGGKPTTNDAKGCEQKNKARGGLEGSRATTRAAGPSAGGATRKRRVRGASRTSCRGSGCMDTPRDVQGGAVLPRAPPWPQAGQGSRAQPPACACAYARDSIKVPRQHPNAGAG